MAFQVQVETSNGYRCGCCISSWKHDSWVESLEEALLLVPVELWDGKPHPFNGDAEINSVTVTDGVSGEKIAFASSSWPIGFGKSNNYAFTCWSGYRPDVGRFETVYSGKETKIPRTWDDVTSDLREAQRIKDLAKAEADLKEAQARLEKLKSST